MTDASIFEKRSAGVLLPVSSLPSKYGIGSFGKSAYDWVDFLHSAKQAYWQVLPLGPTSYGDSPYQSFSAFAGNPYFVDLDMLCEQGLLKKEEYSTVFWGNDVSKVSYGVLFENREPVLRKAYARFDNAEKILAFRKRESLWIEDYALYMSIKASKNNRPWTEWNDGIRLREKASLGEYKKELQNDVDFHVFVQCMFFEQWAALRKYAHSKKVEIIGDIPIYVSLDSSDVWANRSLFQLSKTGTPTNVAGVPPDYFSADGQLWGNPLYDWTKHEAQNFEWWISRAKASFTLYDVLRIDHFRGLESYYSVPHGEKTAKKGKWKKGPGMKFVSAIKKSVPKSKIIAEDLGFLTDGVRNLLKDSGFPGMKVLQFAFDTREKSDYSPYTYPNNSVVYTGTHDNDTLRGWGKTAPKASVKNAMEYMNIRWKGDMVNSFIRLAFQTASDLAIVPMQDWLNLDSRARINTPSTMNGKNWCWRMKKDAFKPTLAAKMKKTTLLYGR